MQSIDRRSCLRCSSPVNIRGLKQTNPEILPDNRHRLARRIEHVQSGPRSRAAGSCYQQTSQNPRGPAHRFMQGCRSRPARIMHRKPQSADGCSHPRKQVLRKRSSVISEDD